MSNQLEAMHQEIETLFTGGVDHIHADLVHRYIDDQANALAELQGALRQAENSYSETLNRLGKLSRDHDQLIILLSQVLVFARVFNDGSDGAEGESAKEIVSIIESMRQMSPDVPGTDDSDLPRIIAALANDNEKLKAENATLTDSLGTGVRRKLRECAVVKAERDMLKGQNTELVKIARAYQSHLAASRGMCDEDELATWDAIDAAIAGVPDYSARADAIEQLRFPTMLRKMWSGAEVQQWLNEQAEIIRADTNGNIQ